MIGMDYGLVEDSCDALGAKYDGKMIGTWGDIATLKFLPCAPHDNGRRRCSFQ